jgi:hypothetical protein
MKQPRVDRSPERASGAAYDSAISKVSFALVNARGNPRMVIES